jgi:hypothetical protein
MKSGISPWVREFVPFLMERKVWGHGDMKKRVMLGVLAMCVTVFGMAFAVDMNGPQGPGGGGVLADLGTNPPIDPPCTCKELSITTVPQIAEVCEKCCLSGVVKWVLTPGTDSYTVKVFIIPGTLAQVGKTSCEDAMSSECEWNYSPCSSGQENFYIKGVNAGVGHIKAVLYKNGVECLQQMKPLTVVRVDSVTPAWTAVSTNVEVTFTATTTPAHHGDNVYWSGGGVPATGHGETFTTKWPNVGCKTVVAKCDGGCNQKEAQVAVVNLDLDIDSDHTSDFGGPQGDAFEDSIEWKLPGPHPHEAHKYVVVNDYYRESEQGKPGYADFAMAVPEGPVPSEIIIPLSLKCECPTDCGLDFSQATIKFEYSSSDPAGVTTSSDRGETIWPIPSGNLRLWKKQGSRNPAHFTGTGSAGDYLAANQEIPAPSLGFPGSMPLYLEGINPSASLGADTIKATVKIPAAAGGIYSFEDLIRCTAIKVDVDLDTDNNNGYEAPDRNLKEDHYEDMPGSMNRPGKILAVNDNDDDQDGIPDFADGYNRYGNVSADDINTSEKLVPVVFEIPIPIDLARAKVKLTYDASDPMGVVTNAQGVYQLPGGSLRIWTKKGNVARKGTSILDSSNPGDYIPAGECTAEEFGFTSGTRTLTNYVEAVRASTTLADKRILFEVDPDERTPPNFIAADAVKLTVLKVESVELEDEWFDGLVVKKGDSVIMKANILPSTYTPPTGEPKWYYQRLKSNGSWEPWTIFGTAASGKSYTHITTLNGIFRVKAVLSEGGVVIGEKVYLRTSDEAYGYGKVGHTNAFGVADTQMQIDIRNAAKDFLGSVAYRPAVAVPPQYGFDEVPAGANKCNIFVAHRAVQSGAVVPLTGGNLGEYAPSADQWAGVDDTHPLLPLGLQTDIGSWTLLATPTYPEPGFIVAHPDPAPDRSGHVGIVDHDGQGIAAGTSGTVNKKYPPFLDGTSGFRKYEP